MSRRFLALLAPLIALVLLFSQSDEPVRAGGVLIFVDTTEDLPATDGNCSLREAIMAANANSNVDNCMANLGGFDQIEFNLGGGTPVINIGATDLPDITAPLVIEGGAGRVELRGPGGSFQDGHNGLTSRRLR